MVMRIGIVFFGLVLSASVGAQDIQVDDLEAPEGAEPSYQAAPEEEFIEPETQMEPMAPIEGEDPVAPVDEEGSELDALAEPFPAIPEDTPPPQRDDDPVEPETVSAPEGTTVTLRGLDKVTGRISEFDVTLNQPTLFGTVLIELKYCEKAPPEEPPEVKAFLQIYNQTASEPADLDSLDDSAWAEPEQVFSGWMFASSPAVSAMEHPIYDVWVIDCKRPAPSISADSR